MIIFTQSLYAIKFQLVFIVSYIILTIQMKVEEISILLSMRLMADNDDMHTSVRKYITPNEKGQVTYNMIMDATKNERQKCGCFYLFLLQNNENGDNVIQLPLTKMWKLKLKQMKKLGFFDEESMTGCLCLFAKTQQQITIDTYQKLNEIEKQHKLKIVQLQKQNIKMKAKLQQLQNFNNTLRKQNYSIENLTKPTKPSTKRNNQQNRNQKQLDMLILFSQPLYDVSKAAQVPPPVSYQTDIEKIEQAIKKKQNMDITINKNIATLANLKSDISKYKPRILHIMCHGDQDGNLQFQDHSIETRGTVDLLTPQRLIKELKGVSQFPQLVFLSACYSQNVGNAFLKAGAKWVICIDQSKSIVQYVCQTFSQTFYLYLFDGQTVQKSFEQAKTKIFDPKNNKKLQCCCHHNHEKTNQHKKGSGCQAKILTDKQFDIHVKCHIPNRDKCKCDYQINGNIHYWQCIYAREALAKLNKNYQIKQGNTYRLLNYEQLKQKQMLYNDNLIICCCYTINDKALNLYEDDKFKLLTHPLGKKQAIFEKPKFEDHICKRKWNLIDNSTQQIQERWKFVSNIKFRQKKLYSLLNLISQNKTKIFCIYGQDGVGKSSFAKKVVNYQFVRKEISRRQIFDLFDIQNVQAFRNKSSSIFRHTASIYENVNNSEETQKKQYSNDIFAVILDNCDNIFKKDKTRFIKELESITNCRFYLIFESQTVNIYHDSQLFLSGIEIQKLKIDNAKQLIYDQLSDILQPSISYADFKKSQKIVEQPILYPKILKILCQLVRQKNQKYKVTIDKIHQTLKEYKNSSCLKTITKSNYQSLIKDIKKTKWAPEKLLLFLSNFQNGLSFENLSRLSQFNKGSQLANSIIPVHTQWKKQIESLFIKEIQIEQNKPINEKQSYFIAPLQNVIALKTHIRRYLKSLSQFNFQNIFGYVAYLCSLLQHYFAQQKNIEAYQKRIIYGKSLNGTGIQSLKCSVEASYVKQVQSQQKDDCGQKVITLSTKLAAGIFHKFRNVLGDINVKISAQNISNNHREDLINVYRQDWSNFNTSTNEINQHNKKVFLCYFHNLLVYIPAFFYEINESKEFVLTKINQSLEIFEKTKILNDLSKRNDIIQLKLNVMKSFVQMKVKTHENYLKNLKNICQLYKKQQNWYHILSIQQMILELRSYEEKKSILSAQDIKQKLTQYQDKKVYMFNKYKREDNWLKKSNNESKQQFIMQKALLFKQGIINPLHRYIILFSKILLDQESNNTIDLLPSQNLKRIKKLLSQSYNQLQSSKLKREAGIVLVGLKLQTKDKIQKIHEIFLQNNKIKDSRVNILDKKIKQRVWMEGKNTITIMEAIPLCRIQANKALTSITTNLIQKSGLKHSVISVSQSKLNQSNEKQIICNDLPESIWKRQSLVSENNISIKHKILTSKNLKNSLLKCSFLLIQANAVMKDEDIKLILVNDFMEQCIEQVNENLIPTLNEIEILLLVGKSMTKVARKISDFKNKPKVIMAINTQNIDVSSSTQILQNKSNCNLKYARELFQDLSQKQIKSVASLKQIHDNVLKNLHIDENQAQFISSQDASICINFSKKEFNDLSHYTQCNNNFINDRKQSMIKRVEPLNICLNLLNQSTIEHPIWINVYGNKNLGKTEFVNQLGKIYMELQPKLMIAFIMDGKVIQDKFEGNFYSYLQQYEVSNCLERGQILKLRKQYWETLVIIDDFQYVNPEKNNETYKNFFNDLRRSRAKVILVSQTPLKSHWFSKASIRNVKIQKITSQQIDILYDYIVINKSSQYAQKALKDIKSKPTFDIRELYQLNDLKQSIQESVLNNQMTDMQKVQHTQEIHLKDEQQVFF